MQYIFIVTAIVGLFLFIFRRRQFDFVSTGYIGMVIYFFPGFVGYVTNPYYPWLYPSIPIVDGTYVIWTFALFSTIITGLIYNPVREANRRAFESGNTLDLAIIATIISTLIAALWFGGEEVLSADKHEVLENVDRFFILFSTSTQIGLIAFIAQGKMIKSLVPAAGVMLLLYLGFRSDIALATIALATYIAYRKGIFTYIKPHYMAIVMAMAGFLLAYKPLLNAYRFGRFDLAESYLESEDFISAAILKSEPFITQTILNEVVSQDFGMGVGAIVYSLVAVVPFLVNILGIEATDITFNFQGQIFPHLTYGAASNIYGHFYATLGAAGIVLLVVLHNLILVGISRGLRTHNPYKALLLLSMGSFFAFYMHRNDLLNSILIVNRSVLTVLIFFVVAAAFQGRFGVVRKEGPAL